MLSRLKKLLNRGERSTELTPLLDDDTDLDWLDAPTDPLDASAWDRYWTEQVRHGLGPPIFDMFCDARELVRVMNNEGMRSVLCAGSGISQEPRALAQAGFHVVALDLSLKAVEIAQGFEFPMEGFEYFCEREMGRAGGHVDFVVGDILDSTVCPGPFDVIIERRTAQIYFNSVLGGVLGALAIRLGQDGILLSHCHDCAWKPPAEPRHFTKSWFQQNRWAIWNGGPGRKPSGRVAWLFTSTG
jgi:hypothetical protein